MNATRSEKIFNELLKFKEQGRNLGLEVTTNDTLETLQAKVKAKLAKKQQIVVIVLREQK